MNAKHLRVLIANNPGRTAAEIVALAAVDKRTVAPIRLDELRPVLAKHQLGGLLQVAAAATADVATKVAILNALAYITSPQETIRSDADFADLFDQTLRGLTTSPDGGTTPPLVSADVAAEILALGGGYAVADATQADVENVIAADARAAGLGDAGALVAQAYTAARDAIDAAANDPARPVPTPDELLQLMAAVLTPAE